MTIQSHKRPNMTIQDHMGPNRTTRNHHTDPEPGIGFSECPKKSEGGLIHSAQIQDNI